MTIRGSADHARHATDERQEREALWQPHPRECPNQYIDPGHTVVETDTVPVVWASDVLENLIHEQLVLISAYLTSPVKRSAGQMLPVTRT